MITKYFTDRGMKVVPEVSDNRFQMANDGSTEMETSELLYAFLRRLKPLNVFETGTYKGVSAAYMAKALQDNGFGHLITIEYEQFHIDTAQEFWNEMGVFQQITVVKLDSMQYDPQERRFQFFFLDTEPFLRFKELIRYYPYLDEGGYVFIHDMPRNLCKGNVNPDHPDYVNWPVGEFPKEFDEFLKADKLRMFHFPFARGMVGFYKPHKDDYKWK